MTTPIENIRYALQSLEFDAYVNYIERQFPDARFLNYTSIGYTLTADGKTLLDITTKEFATYFDIQGFKEVLAQVQSCDPSLWYERALKVAQQKVLDDLGFRNGAVLKVFCRCCEGLLGGLGKSELPFEFNGPVSTTWGDTEKAVDTFLHSVYEAPLPVHGREWQWLNGGTSEL